GLEESLLDERGAGDLAGGVGQVDRAAVAVAVGTVEGSRHERTELLALDRLGRGEGKRAEGAAVEAVVEGDEVLAPRVIAGELHRRLDRLGTGVAEVNLLGESA